MKAKPGDVAIIVKGRWPNVGRIVYVVEATADRDYTFMGYGILPSWYVESLGGDLDTENGPRPAGCTPDISLRRIPDISPEQGLALRKMKARADFDAALADLAKILAAYVEAEEPAEADKQRAGIPAD